jgi:hypothetical protein
MGSLKNYKDFKTILEGSSSDNAEKYADVLLDKIIKGGGIDVLSEREKNFLNGIAKKQEKPVEVEDTKKERKPGIKNTKRKPHIVLDDRVDKDTNKKIKNKVFGKDFVAGDIVVDREKSTRNLPNHAAEFLEDSNEFEVKKVNKSGKIDLGCFRRDEEGKKYTFYFSPDRFVKKGEEGKYGDYDDYEDEDDDFYNDYDD